MSVKRTVESRRVALGVLRVPVMNSSISSTSASNSPAQGSRSVPGTVTKRGPVDVLGQVAPVLDQVPVAVRPGHAQRRAGHRGQAPTQIGRERDHVEGERRGRAGPPSGRPLPPFPEADPVGQARGEGGDVPGHAVVEDLHVDVAPSGGQLGRDPEAVVLGPADPRRSVDEDQRAHPLGVGGRQPQSGHGARVGCQHHGRFAAGVVHDGRARRGPSLRWRESSPPATGPRDRGRRRRSGSAGRTRRRARCSGASWARPPSRRWRS